MCKRFIFLIFMNSIIISFYITCTKTENHSEFNYWVEIIEAYPDSTMAYCNLGLIYQNEKNDVRKAIYYFRKGLEYSPQNFALNSNLMHAYFQIDSLYNGLAVYKYISSINHDKFNYSLPKKVIHKITKNYSSGKKIEFCQEYLTYNAKDIELRKFLIQQYKEMNNSELIEKESLILLFRLENEIPEYDYLRGEIYFDLGTCAFNKQKYEEALKHYENAQRYGLKFSDKLLENVKKKMEESEE